MAQFSNLALTNKGLALQAKAQTGIQLNFTKIAFGDGQLATGENPLTLTALKNKKMDSAITSNALLGDGTSRIRTVITNSNVTAGFYLREVGLFANDPQDGEILYAYANAGQYADFLPAGTGSTIVEDTYDLITIVGNASNVSATIPSGGYVSSLDFIDKVGNVEDLTTKKVVSELKSHASQLAEKTNEEINSKKINNKLKGKVTFTFDGGFIYDYTLLNPIFQEKGIKGTFGIQTSAMDGTDERYMKPSQILEMQNVYGHEIASHTMTHPHLNRLTDDQIENELRGSKERLQSIGCNVTNLIYPFGNYNERVIDISRKYYNCATLIETEGRENTFPINTYKLKRVGMAESGVAQTLQEYKDIIDKYVIDRGEWMIFYTHGDEIFRQQQTFLPIFKALIDYIKSFGIEICTLEKGYQYFKNKIDIGFYGRNTWDIDNRDSYDFEGKCFMVGYNGSFRAETTVNYDVSFKPTISTTIDKFKKGCTTITTHVLADNSSFPDGAGTLQTSRFYKTDDLSYEIFTSYLGNIYKRNWLVSTNGWSDFKRIATSDEILKELSKTVTKTTSDLTYYVATTGNDNNNGLSSDAPFKTIAKAINMIPQIVNHKITINVASGTYNEDVLLSGFLGSGSLTLEGVNNAVNVNVITIQNCIIRVTVNNFIAISVDTNTKSSFFAGYSNYVNFYSCHTTVINNSSSSSAGFAFRAVVYGGCASCVSSNKRNAFLSWSGGCIELTMCSGIGNTVGVNAGYGAKIINNDPSGLSATTATVVNNGGEIIQ